MYSKPFDEVTFDSYELSSDATKYLQSAMQGVGCVGRMKTELFEDIRATLPEGCFVKGGVARAALVHELRGGVVQPPRDVDVAVACDLFPSRVAREMGLDREDVEAVDTLEEYLQNRDFTINEVALFADGSLIATDAAIKDIQTGVIRPSEYEKEGGIRGRICARAALFAARLKFGISEEIYQAAGTHWAPGFELSICVVKAVETRSLWAYWWNISRMYSEVREYDHPVDLWDDHGPYSPYPQDLRVIEGLRLDRLAEKFGEEFEHLPKHAPAWAC